MKRSINLIFLSIGIFLISACQAHFPREVTPEHIPRQVDTPLVVGIPGLNIPLVAAQEIHFGEMTQMLDEENIPSLVIMYDSERDPVQKVDDLSSDKHSISFIRVLPRLATAISQENSIRKDQGLPPLQELDLVTYSQGSVLAWDILRRMSDFVLELQNLKEEAGDEWERVKKESRFQTFNEAAINFFAIHNVKHEKPDVFDKSIDLQNIYYRASKNLENTIVRLRDYVRPESGKSPYPKLVKWIDKNYGAVYREDQTREEFIENLFGNFFIKYSALRYLLPLDIKIFSITGSIFGSPKAFVGYFYSEYFPWLAGLIVKNRADQIRDTRLGSKHHLEWAKKFFEFRENNKGEPLIKSSYFIVGVNGLFGNKGDGLVDQPAAHMRNVRLAGVPFGEIIGSLNGEEVAPFKWKMTPDLPVTGLGVKHMPEKLFFYQVPGAAQMNEESKVYPFLLSFIKDDTENLKQLHEKEHRPLRQFMISIYLPESEELKRKNFELKSVSKDIKITGRYDNPTANSMNWTGYFKSDPEEGLVVLKISKGKKLSKGRKKSEIQFPVHSGKNHFIEIK